jgi:hypothetical protein
MDISGIQTAHLMLNIRRHCKEFDYLEESWKET